MTEKEIYDWFAEDDRCVLIDDVCTAFPNKSKRSIQNILNRLCEKGKFYKVSTAFGDMYAIDSTVQDEVVTINMSTGSGMGDVLRATGAFEGYESISENLIKNAPLKKYGLNEINAKKYKKETYSSEDAIDWLNTVSANREFLKTIKEVALRNLVENLQSRGLSGNQLLAYLEGLSKIELEVIAKERAKQYQKMEEIWKLMRDKLTDKGMLSSLSKELVKMVFDVEDMTINGGQIYYSVPIPENGHYKKEFSTYISSSTSSAAKSSRNKKTNADVAKKNEEFERAFADAKKRFEEANDVEDYKQIADILKKQKDHSESEKLIVKCKEKIEEIEKEKKYQKALSLCQSGSFKKKHEAIKLLRQVGDYKDAADLLARHKNSFSSLSESERYQCIADEIEQSLKEEKKQEKERSSKNTSADKDTKSWIKRKTYVKETIETGYTTGQDLIGRQIQAGSFSGINDPVLKRLIEKNRELMNKTMSQREELLDDIYRYFNNVKAVYNSEKSLNKLIKFYEEVYDDGNGYSLVINGINLADVNFKGIYATRLEEMRRAVINKSEDLLTSKDKESEKRKNIDKALEKAEKRLRELRDEAEANEMKALSLESEQINNRMELDRKKASLHEDNDRREKYTQQEIQSIKDEIQANDDKRKQLSEELSKAEKELEGTFVLNFGKRKELRSIVDSLKAQISNCRNTISDLSEKMIKVQKNKQNQINKENEYISSLEKKITASMTEKNDLEKKKQTLIEEICSAEKEQEAIDKIKKDFHVLYIIKEYGSKYGYDDIVQELKEKGLDYEKYLIKNNTVPKSASVQSDKPAKSQIEKDKDLIREALKRSRTPQTASLLANKTGLSLNRVAALLSQMKEDNEVIRTVSQRKALFELVQKN